MIKPTMEIKWIGLLGSNLSLATTRALHPACLQADTSQRSTLACFQFQRNALPRLRQWPLLQGLLLYRKMDDVQAFLLHLLLLAALGHLRRPTPLVISCRQLDLGLFPFLNTVGGRLASNFCQIGLPWDRQIEPFNRFWDHFQRFPHLQPSNC